MDTHVRLAGGAFPAALATAVLATSAARGLRDARTRLAGRFWRLRDFWGSSNPKAFSSAIDSFHSSAGTLASSLGWVSPDVLRAQRGPSCRAASSPHARIWSQKSLSAESMGCWGAQRPERVATGSRNPRATRTIVLPKCRKGRARTSLVLSPASVVLSPALAWYPRIRRALRGTPTLAHQLRSVTFSEWLVQTLPGPGGTPSGRGSHTSGQQFRELAYVAPSGIPVRNPHLA